MSLDITQRGRILDESIALVENGKSLATRVSRCELVIEHARALKRYEDRGIDALSIPPSKLVADYERRRTQLIVDGLRSDFQGAQRKAGVAATPRARVGAYSKVLLKVQEYRLSIPDNADLEALELEVARLIQETQLSDHLDSARKFEFKGQPVKALDRYYEALFLLRNDAVPDDLQGEHIKPIEAKIRQLGGEIR